MIVQKLLAIVNLGAAWVLWLLIRGSRCSGALPAKRA